MTKPQSQSVDRRERVLLVGVSRKKNARTGSNSTANHDFLDELRELAESAGAAVAGTILQLRDSLDPATLVGRGKLEEIGAEANLRGVNLIIVDHDLTPVQLRNMEKGIGCTVIDRTQLILDIFATHAHTREGQLQVELAQLNYLLPRLAGGSDDLSRLGGGIGTRGPGEQKLETDRRRIRDRVAKIRKAIENVRRQRANRRRARQGVPLGMIAFVGYTNAGKSTLFNVLTGSKVLTSNRMFATLDPTIRAIQLPSRRRVLLSDTVGFIRDLPPGLITAFRATLEEVQEAALIVHVTDISNPHHAEQDAEVEKVLRELEVAERPRLRVFNKMDLLAPEEAKQIEESRAGEGNAGCVFVSAKTGQGLEELRARIDAAMPVDPVVSRRLSLPMANSRELAMIFACGRVVHSEVVDSHMRIEAELPESLAARLENFVEKTN